MKLSHFILLLLIVLNDHTALITMQQQEQKKAARSPNQTRAKVICLIDNQIRNKACSCRYAYSSWQDAHDHIQKTHVQHTAFVCPQCTKQHSNAHDALSCSLTDTQKNFFSCMCKTVYYTYNTLLRHSARCKTINQDKKKIIPILPKPSPAKAHKKHTNQPIFIALINEQSNNTNQNTNAHQTKPDKLYNWYSYKPRPPKTIVAEKQSVGVNNPELYEKALIALTHHLDTKIKEHECCSEKFSSWDHACNHIRNCHKKEKRQFECPSCKEIYKDPSHTLSCLLCDTAPHFFQCPFCPTHAPIITENRAKLHYHIHYKCSLHTVISQSRPAPPSPYSLNMLTNTNQTPELAKDGNGDETFYELPSNDIPSFLCFDSGDFDIEQLNLEINQTAEYQEQQNTLSYYNSDDLLHEYNYFQDTDACSENACIELTKKTPCSTRECNTTKNNDQNQLETQLFIDSPSTNAHH